MSPYDATETIEFVVEKPSRFVTLENAVNAVGRAGIIAFVEQLVSIVRTVNKPGYRVLDVDRTTVVVDDNLISRDPENDNRWFLRRAERDVRDQKLTGKNKTDRYFGELTALVARRYGIALKIVHVVDVRFEDLHRLYASRLYVVLEADRALFDRAMATNREEKNMFIKFHVLKFHREAFDAFSRGIDGMSDGGERAKAKANVFLYFFKNEMEAFAREKKMLSEFERKSVGARVVVVSSSSHEQFGNIRLGAGSGDEPAGSVAAWTRARETTLAVIDVIRNDPDDRLEPLRALIEHGGVTREVGVNTEGRSPLFFASLKGKANAVKYLLSLDDANANWHNGTKGSTALHAASERGHVEVVDVLVNDPRVDVDAQRPDGVTALFLAAMHGRAVVVDVLVARGANKTLKTWFMGGMTPFGIAMERFEELIDEERGDLYYEIIRTLDDSSEDDTDGSEDFNNSFQ